MAELFANSRDPDQMPLRVSSPQWVRHCLFSKRYITNKHLTNNTHYLYLKCPQRRLYSAWKIADIYLRRSAEYWDALSASLRKLEIFSVWTSTIFPYASPQLSAERSADVCGHLCRRLCGRPHGLVQTSAWIGADVRMDGCGCLRKSAWMGADIRRARGSVRVAPPAV